MVMAGTPGSVADAVDYTQIWNDKGTGASMDGAVWRPSAPDGYEAVSDLWNRGYGKPDPSSVYVIAKQCVVQCQQTPQKIYSGTKKPGVWCARQSSRSSSTVDKGSWAPKDVTVWTVGVEKLNTPSPDNYGACTMN